MRNLLTFWFPNCFFIRLDEDQMKFYRSLPYAYPGSQVENRSPGSQECRERYLHDEEEGDDDDDIDFWVDPHSWLAQAFRVPYMLYPCVVVKQGTDGFARHQLWEEEAKGSGSPGMFGTSVFLREPIPQFHFSPDPFAFFSGRESILGQKHICSEAWGTPVLFPLFHVAPSWLCPSHVLSDLTPTLRGHPWSWPLQPWIVPFLVGRWRRRWQR